MAKMTTRKDKPVHLNGDQLCSMDLKTTGPKAGYNELIQLAIIPLGANFEPHEILPPLDLVIQPLHLDRVDKKFVRMIGERAFYQARDSGLHSEVAADIFEQWFKRLNLVDGKKISVIVRDWVFVQSFVQSWIGYENFKYFFWHSARDVLAAADFLNDRADFNAEAAPLPGPKQLIRLANLLGVNVVGKLHEAVIDALLISRVYKKMLLEPFV